MVSFVHKTLSAFSNSEAPIIEAFCCHYNPTQIRPHCYVLSLTATQLVRPVRGLHDASMSEMKRRHQPCFLLHQRRELAGWTAHAMCNSVDLAVELRKATDQVDT